MTDKTEHTDSILRRTVLKASTVAAGAFALSGSATAIDEHEDENEEGTGKPDDKPEDKPESEEPEVDEPEGYGAELLAQHVVFKDDVALDTTITYAEGEMGTQEASLPDGETAVLAEIAWEPGGRTGWHTHPGSVIVLITEGEVELLNEDDCVVRTYTAGEAFVARGMGNVHVATNASDTEEAGGYAMYIGVPDGEPATEWVEPVDC
ncbi:cupin [Natronococcus pandeyae]|uniref:Cupin n=1 Tax=Natronococcus pandeyae TaxID=2055836 RepID=A0A8J8PXQ6_9EURY|nr:cupin domain-containing protein [Natronococcus pandeyae]TYL36395.1 cupin [Natronococcus pandeyae]